MGLFKLLKDVVVLPVETVLDVTMITPSHRIMNDTNHDSPFGTFSRLEKIAKDLEEL